MRPGWGGSVAPGGWRGVAACLPSSRLSAASGRRRCAPLVQAPRGWRRAHATPVYNTGTDGVRTHRHREVAQSTRDASLQHGHRRRQDTQAPRGGAEHTRRQSTTRAQTASGHTGTARWRRAHATPVYNTGTDGVRTHRHREVAQSTRDASLQHGHRRRQDTQAPRGWRRAHATPVYNTGTDGVRTHRHREVAQSTRDASLQHGHRRRQDTQAPRGGAEHTRRQSTTRAQTASGHTGTVRWRRAHATPVYNTGTDGVRTHRHREVAQSTRDASLKHPTGGGH